MLETLYQDAAGKRLITALKDWDITFKYNGQLTYLAMYSKNMIQWNCSETIPELVLLEELVHALQSMNRKIRSDNKMNMEIEAKIALYKYAVKNGLQEELVDGYKKWHNAILPYLENPTADNYHALVVLVQELHDAYKDSEKFGDHPDYRNTENIDPLFLNY